MNEYNSPPIDEQVGATPEEPAVAAEVMQYMQERLVAAETRVAYLDKHERLRDLGKEGYPPATKRYKQAQYDLSRLRAASEASLNGDTRGIAIEVEDDYQMCTTVIEANRRYIAEHPMGTLDGDELYLEKKADILRGEELLKSVGDNPDLAEYLQKKLADDRRAQDSTRRGAIMRELTWVHHEQARLDRIRQLLRQPQTMDQ